MGVRPSAVLGSFDYTRQLEIVISDVVAVCDPLSHIRPECLLAAWTRARVGGDHGVFATIQGLRFEGGAETVLRGGRTYRWPRITYEGREILYVIQFLMPRFVDLPYRAKLTTIFHELYHVSPSCDGDLRRFPGRNYAHGHSRDAYNARLQPWIDEYLRSPGARECTVFLHSTFVELQQRYSTVSGRQIQPVRPQIVPGDPGQRRK